MLNSKKTAKQIQAEIARLQGELADIQEEELKLASAVHILENLGWTRSGGKWHRPVNNSLFGSKPLTKGELVTYNGLLYIVSVFSEDPNRVRVREVLEVGSGSALVTMPFSIWVDRSEVCRTTYHQWAGYKKFA